MASGAWTPQRVEKFRSAFFDFLANVYINSKDKGRYRLSDGALYEAQTRFLDGMLDGLSHDIHDFKVLKSRQLGMCLDPETRVLTADLRWVPIKDIKPLDELIAVDEELGPVIGAGRRQTRQMKTTTVVDSITTTAPAYRITFDDGRSVVCSAQHRWLSNIINSTTIEWAALEPVTVKTRRQVSLKVGSKVRWVTHPWEETSVEDGWFGGMLDGEGSIANGNRSGASINVSQLKGPVWNRLVAYAKDRGYHAVIENDDTPRKTKHGKSPVPKLCFNRMDEIFRLLGQTRPTRFIGKRFWERRALPGKSSGIGWSTITAIEPLGERLLYDLQTTDGTFIAEGFVSHNSTIVEAVFTFYLGMFEGIQAAVIFDTAAHLKACRTRILNIIENLPKSFGYPAIRTDSREMLLLEGGASIQWMAAGIKRTESGGGLGRGSGANLVWCSEISSWQNEEGLQSLLETFSTEYPNRLYIFESTARGYNSWRDLWVDAKQDDLNQRAIFIGWWAKPNQRFDRNDPRFERYGTRPPSIDEQSMIDRVARQYEHDITPEQLAWWRYKMDPSRDAEKGERRGGQYRIQEQPSTEDDAFQQAGSSFFDHVALNTQAARISQFNRPQAYYYQFGSEFPHTTILPSIHWRKTQLRVWDAPQKGVQYVIAADVAFGRNPDNDRSAVQVLACFADCVEQVAEFADATTNTTQFAWVIASLAAWYGTEAESVSVIIEIDGPGEAVWKEWEQLPRLVRSQYMRQVAESRGLTDVFNNVRNYIFSRPDSMGGAGMNWQWKTGNRKEAIMEKLKVYTNDGRAIVKSLDTIDEMRTIARDGASIEAPGGKKDDRVVSYAIGVRAWEDQIRPALITRGRTREAWQNAQKLTTAGRYQVFMENSLQNMFNQNARIAKQAARQARLANMRRR